jgi:hypothetical protein
MHCHIVTTHTCGLLRIQPSSLTMIYYECYTHLSELAVVPVELTHHRRDGIPYVGYAAALHTLAHSMTYYY